MQRSTALWITAAVGLVAVGGYLSAPSIARYVAERKVDDALERIRVQSTSVAHRGEVSVDLWSRTVRVRDISVETPRGASRIRIGALTVVSPSVSDGQLTASNVVFEDVTSTSGGDVTSVPRLEIVGYSGPERGLTTTPGVGRNSKTQADLVGRVSFESASSPVIVMTNEETQTRRTIRNVKVSAVTDGVVRDAAFAGASFEAPYLRPDQATVADAIDVTTGAVVYRDLSLPALWRLYSGDPGGDREALAKTASISDVTAEVSLRPSGRLSASLRKVSLTSLETRSLGYPLAAIDQAAARARLRRDATPAEIREQLSLAVEGAHAFAFDEIAIESAEMRYEPGDAPKRRFRVERAALQTYADGLLGGARVAGLAYDDDAGGRLSLAEADLERFDFKGLIAYAERVGRNEVLLTTAPTAEDVLRLAPRIAGVGLRGLDATGSYGALKASRAQLDVNAPADVVPQHLKITLENLDAAPAPGTKLATLLGKVELDRLKGGAGVSLTLNPTEKALSLDWLDYGLEGLGSLRAKGELQAVDPMLAVATGAAFVDRVLAVRLAPFRVWFQDDGAVAVLLRRAADAAGAPPEIYRETVARDLQATIQRVFGPSAENSAESVARFIRDPRTLELVITPRNIDQSLVDLIRSFDLGPEGIAQTIELSALYRR